MTVAPASGAPLNVTVPETLFVGGGSEVKLPPPPDVLPPHAVSSPRAIVSKKEFQPRHRERLPGRNKPFEEDRQHIAEGLGFMSAMREKVIVAKDGSNASAVLLPSGPLQQK